MPRSTVLLSYSASNKWTAYASRTHPGLNSILLGMSSHSKQTCEFLPCLTVILMLSFLISFTVTIVWQGLTGYKHLKWPAIGLWVVTALLLLFASGIRYLRESSFFRRKMSKSLSGRGYVAVVKEREEVNHRNELEDDVFCPNEYEMHEKRRQKRPHSPTLCEGTVLENTPGNFISAKEGKVFKSDEFSENDCEKTKISTKFYESKPSTSGFTNAEKGDVMKTKEEETIIDCEMIASSQRNQPKLGPETGQSSHNKLQTESFEIKI